MSAFERTVTRLAAALACLGALASPALAQTAKPAVTKPAPAKADATRQAKRDLTTQPTLYTVGYAHLDTEWRWEYPQSISEYLPNTMHRNFALFEKYPDYVFNFSGANRYRLMKEYWPADYAKMAEYIKAGRWFPAGSSMEEGDVNAPSAEAILRQFLYGNEYFQKEFGVTSLEYMLPDCFGFPWSLPSLLAHAGIKGFSTQKLVWGSSVPDDSTTPYGELHQGIPFNVGVWVGPDGKSVVAALNPGSYSGRVNADLSTATALDNRPTGRDAAGRPPVARPFLDRLQEDKKNLGILADYHYYGTGDVGGAPSDSSVMWIQQAVTHMNNPIRVLSSKADQFFKDLTPAEIARLPRYSGEMELQNHSAGSLTSQAYQKRWIRQNEILADAAEKASVAATWLGGRAYPMKRLNDAWTLMMGGHFHDIAAGTATPKSYEFAWNDDVIAGNQMISVLTSGTQAVAQAMNTMTSNTPIVVYNPLNVAREDLVEAAIAAPGVKDGPSATALVVGPDGTRQVAQVTSATNGVAHVVFSAHVPSAGYAVYDVRVLNVEVVVADSNRPPIGRRVTSVPSRETLSATDHSLENGRYKVQIDGAGDISSVFDKKLNKELLAAPMRLALMQDIPSQWPAWNMDFVDNQRPPKAYVGGTPTIHVTEHGPTRVAVTIDRRVDSSRFVQTISLAAGDAGNRVEISNAIDWHMPETVLKATFPLTASDSVATYNWDVGTLKRGNAYDRKFEVPSHQWIDLTDHSGAFGATILTDDKNGSDKLNDNTIRLTLLKTPGVYNNGTGYIDQISQDMGHHEFTYGIAGHAGDFRAGQTDWQAWRLNTPLMAFSTPKHTGILGKEFSLMKVSDPRVRVLAVKRAEASDEIIVRVVEIDGKAHQNVRISFAAPIVAAREVTGQEKPLGAARLLNGAVVTSLTPFSLHSFAIKLGPAPTQVAAPTSLAIALPFDMAVSSSDGKKAVDGFDAAHRTLPAEMLPARLDYAGIRFTLGSARDSARNAVRANGQIIKLPAAKVTRVYLLAAADGDQHGTFTVGSNAVDLLVQDWGGFVGQWDDRTWKRGPLPPPSAANAIIMAATTARNDSVRRARIDSVRKIGGDTMAVINGRGGRGAGGGGAGAANQAPRMYDLMDKLIPGFIKQAPIAWYASHRHTADGANEYYAYSYLFAYAIDVPAGATSITLPRNDKIRVMAITATDESGVVQPLHPLFDTLQQSPR